MGSLYRKYDLIIAANDKLIQNKGLNSNIS
jgi:hypothetical protein